LRDAGRIVRDLEPCACVLQLFERRHTVGVQPRHARKISFAAMDTAVSLTGMENGGITPVGLPDDWPILVDRNVADQPQVIIGSGIRGSKLLATRDALAALPAAEVLDMTRPA
jgi:prolyl-tRNA editing enzyme YbaK/EbsC (Cys-tRNA(Pro) deacylase)